MAGSFSDYLEATILDQWFGKVATTVPTTYHVALYTTAPTDAGGGTEVSGGSYARVAVTNNLTNFPVATGTSPTSKANGTAVTFPTATGNWGTVAAFGIHDDPTAGNLITWADLTTPQGVPSGVTLALNIGNLTITLS